MKSFTWHEGRKDKWKTIRSMCFRVRYNEQSTNNGSFNVYQHLTWKITGFDVNIWAVCTISTHCHHMGVVVYVLWKYCASPPFYSNGKYTHSLSFWFGCCYEHSTTPPLFNLVKFCNLRFVCNNGLNSSDNIWSVGFIHILYWCNQPQYIL